MRMREAVVLSVALGLTSPAVAQPGDTGPGATSHREGEYGGVTPGVEHPYGEEARRRAPRPKGRSALHWVGFQKRPDGSARIFLQMSQPVEVTQSIENGTLVAFVPGLRHRRRNTVRRLDVRYFGTGLLEVDANPARGKVRRARGRGMVVRVRFKDGVTAQTASVSQSREKDGYHYVYLDFPPMAGADVSDTPDVPAEDLADDE